MHDSTQQVERGTADVVPAARRRIDAAVVLVCVAVAAVVGAVVAFSLYRPVPASLATAAAPVTVPLVPEQLADTRSVNLAVELGEPASLSAPLSGTVTGSACAPGSALASGQRTFTIDQSPIVNLHTETPLWRDLSVGAKGADVEALQRELARLGHDVAETGRFDRRTWAAWDRLVEQAGGETEYGTFALSQAMWLPAAEVTAAACPVQLGQVVERGTAVATLPSALLSGAVKSYPAGLVPGARKLVVDSTDVEIDRNGRLTVDGVAALSATDALARYAQSPDDEALQAELVLVAPVTVYPVPPSAVAMTGEKTGCLQPTSGAPVPVTVVSSKLGRSYVTFESDSGPVADEALARPERSLTCT
ncbi:peptidoglycan-binding domain-containing protein [Leifsonia shinshuensis]|uniref:Peptidoglycan-binding protein n=1 Tax=Leifsonia shinshuensis TaxID=150026 RepID=A0A853D275_9MICO|nr:peptidoglycan-binding domain-containing protein [Leifsonia shinshuensis]NYJ24825.1 hypothetical protein [Leifsonia shinshuensis]